MKVRLPITFDVELNEDALKDLQIDFGVAKTRHHNALKELLTNGGSIESFKLVSQESFELMRTLWEFLDAEIGFGYRTPDRLKGLVCLAVMCELYSVQEL